MKVPGLIGSVRRGTVPFAAILAVLAAQSEPTRAQAAERLPFTIAPFQVHAQDTALAALSEPLGAALAVAFAGDKRFRVIPAGPVVGTSMRPIKAGPVEKRSAFDSDSVLRVKGIDAVVHGRLWEQGGRIRLEAVIRDRRGGQETVSAGGGSRQNMLESMQRLASAVATTLMQMSRGSRAMPVVAVSCFRDRSEEPEIHGLELGRDVALSLASALEPRSKAMLPWTASRDLCDVEGPLSSDDMAAIGADAVITGEVNATHERIWIRPELIAASGQSLVLPVVEGDAWDYYGLEESLLADLTAVLDALPARDGQLDLDPLRFPDLGVDELLSRAERELAPGGSRTVAVLLLTRASDAGTADLELQYRLASLWSELDRPEPAIREYEKALVMDSLHFPSLLAVSREYAAADRLEEARAALDRAVTLAREEEDMAAVKEQEGRLAFLRGDTDAAVAAYREALERAGPDPSLHLDLAGVYRSVERWNDAADQYEAVLRLAPGDSAAERGLSEVLVWHAADLAGGERFEEALALLERAESVSALVGIYGWKTYVLNNLERWDETLEARSQATRVGKPTSSIENNTGFALERLGRRQEARQAYERALEIDPENWTAHLNRITLLDDLGEPEAALEAVDHLIAVGPEYAEGYSLRGTLLLHLGDNEGAREAMQRALEAHPDSVVYQNNMAWLLAELGDYEEAIELSEAIIRDNPEYPNIYNHWGLALYRSGDRAAGRRAIEKSLELNPSYGNGYYNLARIAAEEDDAAGVAANLERAIELDPSIRWKARRAPELQAFLQAPRVEALLDPGTGG